MSSSEKEDSGSGSEKGRKIKERWRKDTSARDWDLSAAVSAIDGHEAATTQERIRVL